MIKTIISNINGGASLLIVYSHWHYISKNIPFDITIIGRRTIIPKFDHRQRGGVVLLSPLK